MPHAVDHQAILDRLAAGRGGTRNSFANIDPARTAHLVIDMQNGFMEPGAPVEVPMARGIVNNINRISAAMRAAGGHNVFVRFTNPTDDKPWTSFAARMGPAIAGHRAAFAEGAHHWQLWPGLDVRPGDHVAAKHRFSAFTHGTSEVPALLDRLGVDTLIVTGTLTNCCCESTVRDAMQYDYRVLMVADANAALSDAEHAATLHSLGFVFADLVDTDEVCALVGAPVPVG